MIHYYFTKDIKTQGTTRITDLRYAFYPRIDHLSSFETPYREIPQFLNTFFREPEHPNHILDWGGIRFKGADLVTAGDLIPWIHPKEYKELMGDKHPIKGYFPRFHFGLKKAKRIVAISQESKRQLLSLGYRCDKVLELPISERILNAEKIIEKKSFKRKGFLVVSNNHPRKRIETAIDFTKETASMGFENKITWIGSDIGYSDYERKIRDMALQKNSSLDFFNINYRRIPDASEYTLIYYYLSSKALLVPSLWEGLCLPIVESLYFGCPVIGMKMDSRFKCDDWIKTIYHDLIPVAQSYREAIEIFNSYDVKRTFDELNAEFHFSDNDYYHNRYKDIYSDMFPVSDIRFRFRGERANFGCGLQKELYYTNIDREQRVYPDKVLNLDEKLPFKDKYFDEIRAIDVLEHLQNPLETIKEIQRILKFDSYLTVRVPDKESSYAIKDWSHITFWDEEKMKWLSSPTEYFDSRFRLVYMKKENGNINAIYSYWGNPV